ncbi:hypothetical protein EV421DRAFT_1740939 [Armillaria borealis]|uniref:F-box domain-containing protein n=1 Tax=Armillaria borealis TaxID=47425 RepID=A0AA39MI39_9AGAR|nr:hypothetical protein EV421DRAFT_1740939 [Armillaria borealis]
MADLSVFPGPLNLIAQVSVRENSRESPSGRRLESSDLHGREPILFSHRLDRPVKMLSMSTLAATAYDVLIHTIAFLYVPDVRLLRQIVHQRFYALTMLRIVWTNTFKLDIWSPRGIVFTGVDSMEPDSEKSIAPRRITLLHLDDERTLHDIRSINIKQRSVNLTGDAIALSDDVSQTLIYNWRLTSALSSMM